MTAAVELGSIVEQSALNDEVVKLRHTLRSAYCDETPRCEKTVLHALMPVLHTYVRRFIEGATEATTLRPAQVLSLYLQDILTALLFLTNEEAMAEEVAISAPPTPPTDDANTSAHYVSRTERKYSFAWLIFLCWSGHLSSCALITALYPLLNTSSTQVGATTENQIGPSLLHAPRFGSHRRLITRLLNGLILYKTSGLLAIARVFVLHDRVSDDSTVEAINHVVHLVLSPMHACWCPATTTSPPTCVRHQQIEWKEQVQQLCQQMVPLLVEHADDPACGAEDKPSYLRSLEARGQRIPPETLGQRLHLCTTMLLNALVRLPISRRDPTYRRAYHTFVLANRLLLSPAFAALSLRKTAVSPGEVVDALWRLLSIVDGVELGASSHGLLIILEAVAPGLLCLSTADVVNYLPDVGQLLERLWRPLRLSSLLHRSLSILLVQACSVERPYRFEAHRNIVEPTLLYVKRESSDHCERVGALVRLFVADDSPDNLRSELLRAMAMHCVQMQPEDEEGHPNLLHRALLSAIEEMCVVGSAESIFGSSATLTQSLDLLRLVCPLSVPCLQWCIGMAEHVMSIDFLRMYCAALSERRQDEMARLSQSVELLVTGLRRHSECVKEEHNEVVGETSSIQERVCRLENVGRIMMEHLNEAQASNEVSEAPPLLEERLAFMESGADRIHRCLDTRSAAQLSMTLMDLFEVVDALTTTLSPLNHAECCSRAPPLVRSLLRVLAESSDSYAVVCAVKCLVWMAMYRLDALNAELTAGYVCRLLVSEERWSGEFIAQLGVELQTPLREKGIRVQLKLRVLEIVLGLCDYDTDGRTLALYDKTAHELFRCSFFDVLRALSHVNEPEVVQVAALHCAGDVFVASHSRIPLSSVIGLCEDCFRSSIHPMAKAACSAMLAKVAQLWLTNSADVALMDADARSIMMMGNAMATYHSQEGHLLSTTVHDEAIQMHGRTIQNLLRTFGIGVMEL